MDQPASTTKPSRSDAVPADKAIHRDQEEGETIKHPDTETRVRHIVPVDLLPMHPLQAITHKQDVIVITAHVLRPLRTIIRRNDQVLRLARGHLLIEGTAGVAKTILAHLSPALLGRAIELLAGRCDRLPQGGGCEH